MTDKCNIVATSGLGALRKSSKPLGISSARVQEQQPVHVCGPLHTVLSESKLGAREGQVTELLPLCVRLTLANDGMGAVQQAKLHRQLKPVVWVRGNVQSFCLESLSLEEASDGVVVLGGNLWQERLCSFKIAADDVRLVLQHREEQSKRHDGELLVNQVQAVVLGDVPQQIHAAVQVLQSLHFATDAVVEAVVGVGVHKAVA
mmetsp:Transcript_25323/g.58326  ORF Transcript_25323/g.58326 Transcript_25323/m.58326 type:complete len:203 (+) Transcript_25323:2175-2783(+)